MRIHVLRGGLSGLVVVSSVLVYDSFSRPAPMIAPVRIAVAEPAQPSAAAQAAPVVAALEQAEAPAAPLVAPSDAPLQTAATSAKTIDTPSIAVAATFEPFGDERRLAPAAPAASRAPMVDDLSVAVAAPAGDIVDPPRLETASSQQGVAPKLAAMADAPSPLAPEMTAAPDVAAPVQVASLVAVGTATPPLQPSQVTLDAQIGAVDVALLSDPAGAPLAPSLPNAADAPAQPILDGERALIQAEISLNAPSAFDPDHEWIASYASLIEPKIDAPHTPDMNVDPAAVAAPLDTLSSAPHARTPELKAPAVVAVLGAEPPAGFADVGQPGDPAVGYKADAGRDEARNAVLNAAAEGGWRRYAVAPPANPQNLPVLAIVIDEIGSYGAPVEEVAALSPMVSTSVIPTTPDAAGIVERLRASGREVLVHMPMETYADFKEGPKPIVKSMTDEEVRETARWHLSQFTGYVGVNNHLGSKVTRDPRVMGALMAELSQRGLLFIDSRTTTKSIAEQVAHESGVLASRNNRFIDNELSVDAIMRELNAAAAYARNHGAGIALGNPNPVTVRAVKQWMELNDGKTVLVAPITHVTSVIDAQAEQAIASR